MANPNVFQSLLQPVRSTTDYANDYAKADQLRGANAMQALTLQQATNVQGQKNALRNLVQSGQIDLSDPGGASRALTTAPDVAPGLLKTIQEGKTSAAQAAKDLGQAASSNASAGKTAQETQIANHQQHLQSLSAVNTPQDGVNWLLDGVRSGAIPEARLAPGLQALQQASATPEGFAQWKQQTQQGGQTVQQQMEMTAAKPTEVRLGNVVKTIDMNPRSQTFGKEVVGQQQIGTSPDTVANNQTSMATNAATNATSRANNAATITKDLSIAGVNPDGSIGAGQEAMAQLIAAGKAQAPTGMAAARPGVGALMARVQQINPDYDATTYGAKAKAARDFSSGTQGNAMRSFAVAGNHLDQLGQLVDGLGNGNLQIVNKIGNAYAEQTGNAAPTNFDAAKDVVSKEVVKAIVAGGGGVAERAELAELMSKAKSPAQLKGVIQQYRNLMGAQHDALLQQRRAAGLPDSTLPKYSSTEKGSNEDLHKAADAILNGAK